MKDIVKYLICFLLGERNKYLAEQVDYSVNSKATITIVPSSFFDEDIYMTRASLPKLPLKMIEGVPLLFGSESVEQKNGQLVIYADILASTFFLITRYEECLNLEERDCYGRFIGKNSLMYKAGFLMRPVVDEYGKLLRKWLRKAGLQAEEPSESIEHVYLTHDVDVIWQWDNLRRALRTFIKKFLSRKANIFESLKAWYNYEKYDKAYTFPWLTQCDQSAVQTIGKNKCTSVYFIKGGGDAPEDNKYYKKKERVKKLGQYLKERGCVLGIHASFSAGEKPELIQFEKENLEKMLGEEFRWNRSHYLLSKEPMDMESLILAGITDDFTMGYADVVGFRLGTCRPVHWINPFTKQITSLMLHPLTVMECTLDSEQYMGLNEKDAYKIICELLDTVKLYNGEVVLLWHNTSVALAEGNYQHKLYESTLSYLDKIMS